MDASILTPTLAFAGTLATAIVFLRTAVITNRSEKEQTAKTAVERGLEEQLDAKDERLRYRDDIILQQTRELEQGNKKIQELSEENRQLRKERDRYWLAVNEGRAEEREKTNGHQP